MRFCIRKNAEITGVLKSSMMRSILTAVMVRKKQDKSCLTDELIVITRKIPRTCTSIDYKKIKAGKRTVRKKHYTIQPHDIIIHENRKRETSGCHCNGTGVILLPDKKSVSIKKVKIYKYAGGYFKSAFN